MKIDSGTKYEQIISLQLIHRYLRFNGWSRTEKEKADFAVYSHAGSRNALIEILLPRNGKSSNVDRRIKDALRTLCQLYEKTPQEIANDIRNIGADIFRSSIPDDLVIYDSIKFEVAEKFIKELRRLLEASATTEIEPKPFFGRIKKEAQTWVENCRFGHTFQGSFGFTIESPLRENPEPTMEIVPQEPPFERRVIQRLIRGLKSVEAAESEQDSGLIYKSFEKGLSANMCDRLANLIETMDGSNIIFDFALSPEWRYSSDVLEEQQFEVRATHLELIKDAALQLRDRDIESNHTVVGRVIRLRSETDPSNLLIPTADREITVQWEWPGVGRVNVSMDLNPQQYLEALEAHKAGRSISATGNLKHVGKRWTLKQPEDFQLLL